MEEHLFLIEVYSDDREVNSYALRTNLTLNSKDLEQEVEDLILSSDVWYRLYDLYVGEWGSDNLAEGYSEDDEFPEYDEEWEALIGPHATLVDKDDKAMVDYLNTLIEIKL